MTSALPDAAWRHRPGLDHLLVALGADKGETRFVGGAVRDGLLAMEIGDIDLATQHAPPEVLARLELAGIKAVPTGIAHGTITAVVESHPYEITTLRSDVATDGRRATVAYTQDWRADAARRDFTINALYAHCLTGEVTDFFGGLDDLATRTVRFIGSARDRIVEDHLRILRFFRFFARYGKDEPDPDGYKACVAAASSLMALSRERVADELLKLLALPDPLGAVEWMIRGGIFLPVLPEITAEGAVRLARLLARERAADVTGSALLRLCALLPGDTATAVSVGARLKLSNKARKRITAALGPPLAVASVRELAYRAGAQAAQDIILLDPARDAREAAGLDTWEPPEFGIGGATLISLGLPSGPAISRALAAIKERWIAEDFPGPARVREIAGQVLARLKRDSQN